MLQYGLRLHDSAEAEFTHRLKNVKEQGFDCVHIALSKVGMPQNPENLTPGYAAYVRKAFREAELDIAVLGCYLNLGNPNEAQLKKIQNKYCAYLRFASLLGCGVVGTETGAPNETYTYDKEACHSEEALEMFIKNLRPVVEDAEKSGVILAIEPVYRHIVYSPRRARKVLDTISSPNLQIIFDPVNLLDVDNLHRREEIIEEAMDLLGEDIAVLHLKDYYVNDNRLICVGAGEGEMDYSRILNFAREKKPFMHATLENTKPENAVRCLEYLKHIENTVV